MRSKSVFGMHKFSRGIFLSAPPIFNRLRVASSPSLLRKLPDPSHLQYRLGSGLLRPTDPKFEQELPEILEKFQGNLKRDGQRVEETWELYCRIARYQKVSQIPLDDLDIFVKGLLDFNKENSNALSWVNRVMRDCHLEGRRLALGVYRDVFEVYSRLGLYNDINNLYDDLKIAGVLLDTDCYNVILEAFEACQNRTMVNRYLGEMKKAGVHIDKTTVDLLVVLELNQSRIKEAEALYEELTSATDADSLASEKTLCRLIHGFIEAGDLASAVRWHQRLQLFPADKLGVAAHNISLALARKAKDSEKLVEAFRAIQRTDKLADVNTFTHVIGGLAEDGRGDLAMQYFHDYLASGLPYSTGIYNMALKALFVQGKPEEAMSLYQSMGATRTDIHTYTEVITGLCLAGDLGGAREILAGMEEAGVGPAAKIFRRMIRHHMKAGQVDFAIDYFNKLVRLPSEPPNTKVYATMVFGLLGHGQIDEAMNAYFHMRRQNLLPSEQEYFRIVSSLTKANRMDMARKLFDDMVAQGISPSNATYAALISGYGHAKDIYNIMSLHLFIKMDVSRDPNLAVWNALMNAYNRAGYFSKAIQIWDMLWHMECPLDNASVSIILDCCSHHRELDRFDAIWLLLGRRGFPLNNNNYCSYIEGLARLGQVDQAVDYVTREMRQRGVSPSLKTIDTLLSFLLKYNKSSEHRRVVAVFLRDSFPDHAHLISKRISSEF